MEIQSAPRLYGEALDIAQPAAKPGPDGPGLGGDPNLIVEPTGAPSFAEAIGDLAENTVETVRAGEAAAAAMVAGKADPHSVVEALAATEMALEMAVTVRDKVVEAYQEILRMPV